jgi:1-phosphofructokinase family hexose kinase
MILIVNLNPALDKTVVTPGFTPGQTARVTEPRLQAGGKGFNVARALRTLGPLGRSLVVGHFAGHTGRLVQDLAQTEGLACDGVWVAGETRTCLSIIDPAAGLVTDLNEAGPTLPPNGWPRLMEKIKGLLPKTAWLLACGSTAPGTPENGLAHLVQQAAEADIPVILDTYGPKLAQALAARPFLVKINAHEAADLLNQPVDTPAAALAAAAAIQQRGAANVLITLGAAGAVGCDQPGHNFSWAAPVVPGVSPVGSGDSLLAGVVTGLAAGGSLAQAARLGIAAGAANTLQVGAGNFTMAQVQHLLTEVTPLAFEA